VHALLLLEGDLPQGFHLHLHILVSDGCFHENGMFSFSPNADTKALEQIFRHKVLNRGNFPVCRIIIYFAFSPTHKQAFYSLKRVVLSNG
jgi:hypothetical protein